MKVVRAIRKEDLEGLLYLTTQVGLGMTSLKPNKDMLSKRIAVACDSFAEKIPPEHRDYVFVLEETNSKKIVGVCAIKARIGLVAPFYNYHRDTVVHASQELNVHSRMDTLHLSNDLTGCSELCSVFLHPDYRDSVNGKLLSKSRFLFIAQFPHLFSEKLIAELRGYQRPDGSSPFWDNVGRHFFQMDFSRADDLSTLGNTSFIAQLLPRHPLYVHYFTEEAKESIGRVHRDTLPARYLLEEEGFHYEGYIDVFDAGPVLQTRLSELRSSRLSELVTVVDATSGIGVEELTLVANTNMHDYRIIVSDRSPSNGQVQLTVEQQQVLQCPSQLQSQVRTLPMRPKKDTHD